MATLTLDRVWINRIDTGEGISGMSVPGRQRSSAMDGAVHAYSGGRRRAITVGTAGGSWSFILRLQTLSNVEQIESWIGVPVQVRDNRSQVFYGVYLGVSVSELRDPAYFEVGIDLQLVTVPEGV